MHKMTSVDINCANNDSLNTSSNSVVYLNVIFVRKGTTVYNASDKYNNRDNKIDFTITGCEENLRKRQE